MFRRVAHGPATIQLGDLEVRRLGFGAMRLAGADWGEPADTCAAHAVLRRAIEHGVNFIDTAWYYGPLVANRLIAEALHPYPSDLVIATKVGARRLPDRSWVAALTREELRDGVEEDLRSLRLTQLPLAHLRWIDQDEVTFAEALDSMIELRDEGKIRHLGLSNVQREQVEYALTRTEIVSVQNAYDMRGPAGSSDGVLELCEERGIAFLPYMPAALGGLTSVGGALDAAATRQGCTPAQLAIAWLLARSPVMLPIPGTSKVAHLDENMGALRVALDEHALAALAPNA